MPLLKENRVNAILLFVLVAMELVALAYFCHQAEPSSTAIVCVVALLGGSAKAIHGHLERQQNTREIVGTVKAGVKDVAATLDENERAATERARDAADRAQQVADALAAAGLPRDAEQLSEFVGRIVLGATDKLCAKSVEAAATAAARKAVAEMAEREERDLYRIAEEAAGRVADALRKEFDQKLHETAEVLQKNIRHDVRGELNNTGLSATLAEKESAAGLGKVADAIRDVNATLEHATKPADRPKGT